MTERAPRTSRLLPGLYFVEEGEAKGWSIEHNPMERPQGALLGLPWVVADDRRRVVSEHLTLSDARGSLPRVSTRKRPSMGTLNDRSKP